MNIKDIKTKKLDIFKIPMNSMNLIEASAGTGKTATIVLLYLRLLLGIGNKKNNSKKFLIHEILVVTFTNSAKEELYIRIKNSIYNLYLACIDKRKNDDFLSMLLFQEIQDIDEAAYILKTSYNNINNASIYTIHGFCQKILQLHTFHINYIFEEKIIDNEDYLYVQATQDFWRTYFYNLPENIIKIISEYYSSPDALLKEIKPLLHIKSINFKKKIITNETLVTYHEKNIQKIKKFKIIWLKNYQSISKKINNLNINKKIYSKFNLSKWINNITIWAQSTTKNYQIPIVLKYFKKTYIEKNTTNNAFLKDMIFIEIEKILKNKISLKNIIIFHALKKIPKLLFKEKKKQSLLGFDDLLSIVLKIIKKEKNLKNIIGNQYPVAFVDEFQDTDIQQYKIFDFIYKKNKKTTLFLVGDPKQAIYSFRGADIFSYLYAKSKIKNRYYLNINWRSSENMCKSINLLFSHHNNPFLFKHIPFIPILPSLKNSKMSFKIKGIPQTALRFFLQEKKEVYIDDYRNWISKQCANEIYYWLSCAKKGEATIITKKGERILKSNDIAILVRNKIEAKIIQNELKNMNIISTYSSYKDGVFQTFDAQELLWILQSILEPTNKKLLQQSISTRILQAFLYKKENALKNNNSYLIIEKLYKYYNIWKKTGIFYMIKTIILEYKASFNAYENYETQQKNINFLHIAELLQEKYQYFCKKISLIRWFQKKTLQKNISSYNERIRFFDESKSVKIMTIHKSKGLEYPIVWIPFSIDFNQSKLCVYHNKKNFKIFFDAEEKKENLKAADEERLAEDIRFLYVAMTRSILHCNIGIAHLIKKNNKKNVYCSALAYIIKYKKYMNYEDLFQKINTLSNSSLIEIKNTTVNFKVPSKKKNKYFIYEDNILKEEIKNIWNITSFTKLNQENLLLIQKKDKNIKTDFLIKNKTKKHTKLTIHNFPEGKKTGLLMHYILKNVNFINKKDCTWYSSVLEMYDFSKTWALVLMSWINNIFNTPLNNENIILSKLKEKEYTKELEFFLPIKNILYSTELNEIIQIFDPISLAAPKFMFNPVTGILKGFIDLVFFWKNKYYILDYKSNWLGKDNNFYCNENIKKEIIKHRYDLQYQIYSIAINQYLKQKIKKYNYNTSFGGIFYMFLRGIECKKNNNGVFYTIPNYLLIEKLTSLIFKKKT